jgi:hypothetical protein
MTLRFAALYRASHLDSATEQEKLLRERGLTGVRMRNDRERTTLQLL